MLNVLSTQDWIFISVAFYFLILIAASFYVFYIKKSSLFEPVSIFLFFITLFTLPLPIRFIYTEEIEGNVSPMLLEFASWMPIAVALTAISLVVFIASYYSIYPSLIAKKIPKLPSDGLKGTRFGIIFLIAFCFVLIYLLTQSVGGIVPFLLLGYKSSEETFGKGYLAVGFPWLVVASLAFLDRYSHGKKWPDAAIGLFLIAINIGIFVITGNRSMIMYLVIACLVFFNYGLRKIKLTYLVPIAIVGFLLLNLMGALRGSNYDDLGEFVEQTFSINSDASERDKESYFYTLTIGEFVVPFETLPQIMRKVGITEMPWLGMSYIRSPIYLIPSFLFPERPLPIGSWYMEKFYGGGYGLNEGRQFFFLAEAYLNFGPFGIILISIIWGVLWSALYQWMLLGRDRYGTVLIYALMTAFMFRCIAGDIITLLVGTTQQSLAAVFLIVGFAYLIRKIKFIK